MASILCDVGGCRGKWTEKVRRTSFFGFGFCWMVAVWFGVPNSKDNVNPAKRRKDQSNWVLYPLKGKSYVHSQLVQHGALKRPPDVPVPGRLRVGPWQSGGKIKVFMILSSTTKILRFETLGDTHMVYHKVDS
jgi:hypothetical protein